MKETLFQASETTLELPEILLEIFKAIHDKPTHVFDGE